VLVQLAYLEVVKLILTVSFILGAAVAAKSARADEMAFANSSAAGASDTEHMNECVSQRSE
jgi:hypothetical protein